MITDKDLLRIIKKRGGNKLSKSARPLHNHETLVNEKTGGLYHEGCPTCESNNKFIQTITKDDCTQEEYNRALKEYRKQG